MAKQNSVNLDITNNADGFDISGGTTSRKLTVSGADLSLTGSGSATLTFPTTSTTIAGLGIAQTFTAVQSFGQGSTGAGEIRLLEDTDDGSNYTGLRGSARSANITYVMPTTDPTGGQVLSAAAPSSNVSQLSWTTASASPGGSDTYIQFNDGGSTFGGDAGLTYNKTTDTLVAGRIETTGFEAKTVGGDEGGEMLLGKAVTNTTLSGTGVTIDVYRDKLRIFEQGGTARGVYIDISSAGAGVSTNLLASSASPGGSDTYVQFNDGSAFGGDAGLTYNKTTDTLTIAGDLAVNGGDLTTSASVLNVFDNGPTTINIGTSSATTVSLGANANGAAVNMCNGNITFSRTGSGMVYYSNLTDGSASGMNIKCNPTGSPIQIGDTDGANNTTILMVDDSSAAITFYTGTGSYTFPGSNGSNGQVLTTNGSGTLTWSTPTAGASGSDTQVQFNDGGSSLGGDSGLTYNKTTDSLTVGGRLTAQSVVTTSTTQTVDFSSNINQISLTITGVGASLSTSLAYIENRGLENITVTVTTGTGTYSTVLENINSYKNASGVWCADILIKPPFIRSATSYSAETVTGETINRVDITELSDYWTSLSNINIAHKEETYVIKTVTGQTWVASDSCISCRLLGGTSTDHDVEDAILEEVKFEINNLVVGTGFDIIGYAPNGTYGKYTVKCFAQ